MNPELLAAVQDVIVRASGDPLTTQPEVAEQVARVAVTFGVRATVLHDYDEVAGDSQFDVLLSDETGTISLSYARCRATPWPLRGAQRWGEQDVVVVNSEVATLFDVGFLLDALWQQVPLLERLVDECIMRAAIAKRGLEVSAGEVDAALEEFRCSRGLADAFVFGEWLRVRGLAVSDLRLGLGAQRAAEKLREIVAGESPGDQSAIGCARVALLRYTAKSCEEVKRVAHMCQSGKASLVDLVGRSVLEAGEVVASIVVVSDADLPDSWRRVASEHGAIVGTIFSPVQEGDRWTVAQVLAREELTRSAEARKAEAFERWLAAERRAASVRWLWGRGPLPFERDMGQRR